MIYTGNTVVKNRRKWGEKEHPVGVPRDVSYSWRMGRDSNPRWSCPHNGFQDRRNRPLCHPSETFFCAGLSNRRFCSLTAPGGAAHHSFALDCAMLVSLTRTQDRRNRPRLSPIRNCSMRRSLKPTVLFADRTWRCCSPLVRARLRDACLADSYARPSQSTAALTHPKLFYAPVWASIFFVFWVSRVSLYMFFF